MTDAANPYRVDAITDSPGTYQERWMVPPPGEGVVFQVTAEAWVTEPCDECGGKGGVWCVLHNGHDGPCYVRVTFPVTVNRRRDSDGPAPTVKACVDGLVDAGCWPDDTPEYVETLGSRFVKGAEFVVVELIPRSEAAA